MPYQEYVLFLRLDAYICEHLTSSPVRLSVGWVVLPDSKTFVMGKT